MKDTIAAGSILVAGGVHLPGSIVLQNETDSNGWAAIEDSRPTFERTVQEAGWTFFFMAGEIKAVAFGFDKRKAIHSALKRLIAEVRSQHCNSIEITQVTGKTFLKVPYVSVFAHPRHLQKGLVFSGQQ
jgi:hypothetical protein